MTSLVPGGASPLGAADVVVAEVTWERCQVPLECSAFLLDEEYSLASKDMWLRPSNVQSPSGSADVRRSSDGTRFQVQLDLESLAEEGVSVVRLALTTLQQNAALQSLAGVHLRLWDPRSGEDLVGFVVPAVGVNKCLEIGELIRAPDEGWSFIAIGTGFDGTIVNLANMFG